jgi:hypothetical protein
MNHNPVPRRLQEHEEHCSEQIVAFNYRFYWRLVVNLKNTKLVGLTLGSWWDDANQGTGFVLPEQRSGRKSSTAQVPLRAPLHQEPHVEEKKRRRAKGGAVRGLGDGVGEGGGAGASSLASAADLGAQMRRQRRGLEEARTGRSGGRSVSS